MSVLLPILKVNMAYNTIGGNDIARVTAIWMQYVAGISRQSNAEQNFYWFNSDDNNLWNTNYSATMIDLKQILRKSRCKV